jgi:3-dehydrosphinganine reductase
MNASAHPSPIAWITGASRGIGSSLALELAGRGFSLGLIARDLRALESVAAECRQAASSPKAQFTLAVCDVSDQAAVRSTAQALTTRLGAPDWLILNAGVARPGKFEELDDAVFTEAMAVNFYGSLYLTRECLPAMRRGARIVFVNSGAGISGLYGYSAYGASKFAQRGLAESLRMELKPRGISVTIAYPPDTETDQLAAEQATKPAATKAITAQGAVWKPQAIARRIIRNAHRRRFLVVPGIPLKLFYGLHADGGWFLRWYLDLIVKRHHR